VLQSWIHGQGAKGSHTHGVAQGEIYRVPNNLMNIFLLSLSRILKNYQFSTNLTTPLAYTADMITPNQSIEPIATMTKQIKSGYGILLVLIMYLVSSCGETEKKTATRPNLYPIKENSRYGYMDDDGKIVVPPSFDFAWDLQDGMGRIKTKGKYGFVNEKGEIIIKAEFAYADDFREGYARVNTTDTTVLDLAYTGYDLNKGWTFIDKKGVVFSQTFAKAEYLKTGFAQVKTDPGYDAPWLYVAFADGQLNPQERNTEAMFAFNGHDVAPASETETGKIGAINRNEEWVIQPVFDAIEPFSEGFAAAKKDNQYGYIDTNGKWIFNQVVSINENYFLTSDFRPFTNGLAIVKVGQESYSFLTPQGKIAFDQKFKTATPFNADGYAIVATEQGPAVIDKKGNFVVKPGLDVVSVEKGIVIFRNKDLSYGAMSIDSQKEIAPASYDEITLAGNLVRLKNKGATYGFINSTGEFSVLPQYDMAWPFAKGKAIVERNGKYTYVDKGGKTIGEVPEEYQPYYYRPTTTMYAMMDNGKFGFSIPDKDGLELPAEYDFATDFEAAVARVNIGAVLNEEEWQYNGGKWGLIDSKGKAVVPVTYELILPFVNDIALFNIGVEASYSLCEGGDCGDPVYYSCKGGKWGLINKSGEVILEPAFNTIVPFGKNYLVAREDSTFTLVASNGSALYDGQLSLNLVAESEGEIPSIGEAVFVKAFENGKAGVIDSQGKWILPPSFDDVLPEPAGQASPFYEGLIRIQREGQWGMADLSGEIVIPTEYDEIWKFSSGLAAVRKGDRWGYINKQNQIVIEPAYHAVRDFQGGVAIVQPEEESDEGVIDMNGKWVFAPARGVTFDYMGFVHGLCVINGTEENEEAGYPVSTTGVINSNGKIIFAKTALSEARIQPNGILYAIKNGKWAIATHDGAMLTGYNYNWIEPFTGQTLIRCNIGGDISYGEYGEEEDAYGGRWGYVDKTGKVRIPFLFSEAGTFVDGLAPARTADDLDQIGYVDLTGKIVRPLTK
jgi:hypothetical protein